MNIENELTCKVTVKYNGSTTIRDIIQSGRYDVYHKCLNDRRFAQVQRGQETVIIQFFRARHHILTHDALDVLYKHNCRPINTPELLAIGSQYPDLFRGVSRSSH